MSFTSPRGHGSDTSSEHTAANDVSDNVGALREDVAKLAESVKRLAAEQFGTSVEDVQEKAKEKVGDLETTIRRHPTQSALIAAGIGLVVGLIVSR